MDTDQKSNIDTPKIAHVFKGITFSKPLFWGIHVSFRACLPCPKLTLFPTDLLSSENDLEDISDGRILLPRKGGAKEQLAEEALKGEIHDGTEQKNTSFHLESKTESSRYPKKISKKKNRATDHAKNSPNHSHHPLKKTDARKKHGNHQFVWQLVNHDLSSVGTS